MQAERTDGFLQGMNDAASSADDFGQQQCELILNARVDYDGAVAALAGSVKLPDTDATATYGRALIQFQPSTGSRQLIRFLEDGGATVASYSTNGGATWTEIANTLPVGDWSLVSMSVGGVTYLIGAVGGTTMYKWDGTTWGTITGPVTGVKQVAVFNERLYATTWNSVVYGSKVADFNTWAAPDGVVLPIQTHDAENITNMAAAGSVLLVQKRNSTAYVDGFGNSDIIVASGARGLSRSVGCIAPRTFVAVGSGYVWMSDRGLETWNMGGEIQQIALGARKYFTTIAKNRITDTTGTGSGATLPCAVYWPLRNEYWIAWPGSARTLTSTTAVNDEGLIVNLTTGAVSRRTWSPPANETSRLLHPASMCLGEVTVGSQSYAHPLVLTKYGDVLLMEYGTLEQAENDATGGYALDARIRSRLYDFRQPSRKKQGRVVRLTATETADQTVTAYMVADGTAGTGQAVSFATGVDGKPQLRIARFSARGLNLQVELRFACGFKLSGIELHAQVMGGSL